MVIWLIGYLVIWLLVIEVMVIWLLVNGDLVNE